MDPVTTMPARQVVFMESSDIAMPAVGAGTLSVFAASAVMAFLRLCRDRRGYPHGGNGAEQYRESACHAGAMSSFHQAFHNGPLRFEQDCILTSLFYAPHDPADVAAQGFVAAA
jgi:hypothetical protein